MWWLKMTIPINNYYFCLDQEQNVVSSSTVLLSLLYDLITKTTNNNLVVNYQPLTTPANVSFKIINGIRATGSNDNDESLPPIPTSVSGLKIADLLINNQEYQIVNFALPSDD